MSDLTCTHRAWRHLESERGRAERKLIDAGRKEGNRLSQIFESIAHQQDEWRRVRTCWARSELIRATKPSPRAGGACGRRRGGAGAAVGVLARGWRLEQEELQSWPNCLLFVPAEGGFHDLKRFGRLLTTDLERRQFDAVAGGVAGADRQGEPAGMLLFGRRGQPACWNPFDNDAGNYNVAVVGESSPGKSVFMQELVARRWSAAAGGRWWSTTAAASRTAVGGRAHGLRRRHGGVPEPVRQRWTRRGWAATDYRHDALELIAGVIKNGAAARVDEMDRR